MKVDYEKKFGSEEKRQNDKIFRSMIGRNVINKRGPNPSLPAELRSFLAFQKLWGNEITET